MNSEPMPLPAFDTSNITDYGLKAPQAVSGRGFGRGVLWMRLYMPLFNVAMGVTIG